MTQIESTIVSTPPVHRSALLTKEEARYANRELRRRKIIALGLVVPLLLFLFVFFVAPIATMLHRGFYNPVVAELIPQTLEKLQTWDERSQPDETILTSMALDLQRLAKVRKSGKLAEEINRHRPGSSSVVKSTARKLRRKNKAELRNNGATLLIAANQTWSDPSIWHAVRKSGQIYSDVYYLTAMDLERNLDGNIQIRESAQIYVQLYLKTLKMALIITLMCLLLGYPLSFYLANAPPKKANLLMIFVLLPFFTSLLVRTTAWIALLQTNGVINTFLMSVNITSKPLEMLYTEFSTIIAMTHILLPFMILPLYSV
ncbi:MAG: ABC transporter permease, partial [Deltaproteobacteria bacterium]|nr:ABC transporter permease [Deltaproteobacteria bacterium]